MGVTGTVLTTRQDCDATTIPVIRYRSIAVKMLNSILDFMAGGMWQLSIWQLIVTFLVMVQVTIAAVTLYLHRSQAHRGVDLHPLLSHFFRLWLWMSTGMLTREWVAVHRKHHAKCETEEDPHSPMVEGINKVLFDGVSLYKKETENQETLDKYGRGTPDDWIETNIYSRYKRAGIVLMLLVNLAMFGVVGLSIWALQLIWIPFWAAGVINGAGHFWGYRTFHTLDTATNLTPFAFWIGGEELHNNHHAFPGSAKFSIKPWEFDIGWMYLRILSAVGLAKVKKVAPMPIINANEKSIDLDTLKAVFANRLHVMASYARKVTRPVLKEHKLPASEACSCTYRKLKALLVRDQRMMDDCARTELNAVLDSSDQLNTVYQFRLQLQQVWERTATSHEHLVQALKDWCVQAEATGIKVLEDFAQHLREYSLQPAR